MLLFSQLSLSVCHNSVLNCVCVTYCDSLLCVPRSSLVCQLSNQQMNCISGSDLDRALWAAASLCPKAGMLCHTFNVLSFGQFQSVCQCS